MGRRARPWRNASALAVLLVVSLLWRTGQADAPPPPVQQTSRGTVTYSEAASGGEPGPLGHVPDELLVRFAPGVTRSTALATLASIPDASRREFRSVAGLYHLRLGSTRSALHALERLRASRDVAYVEPNYIVRMTALPDDPQLPGQWALQNTGQTGGLSGADIGAAAAWDVTTGSSSVVVAVLDTGIDYGHVDLAGNVFTNAPECVPNGVDDDLNGYVDDCHGIDTVNDDADPMDDAGHGTHVAGTIGATGNNGVGVVGVNWDVTLLPCKMLDATGSGDVASAIGCLDYVAMLREGGVNIVATSNSWGGGLHSQALVDAIEVQMEKGILFVAAAGNSGRDNDVLRFFPCSYDLPNILCVAATDASDQRPAFSNYGATTVHLGAPGAAVLSTLPGDTYGLADGTSMAAPHVSGVAALLQAQDPSRDWRAVKNLLLAGGEALASLDATISGRRLSAAGSLACTTGSVLARKRPRRISVAAIGGAVPLEVLNIDCALPGGAVSVIVSPGSEVIPLSDDGQGPDRVADDGLFAGTWTPSAAGPHTLTFPDGEVVALDVDPHLEPGFPVKALASPGTFQGGAGIHTLVGNIDDDPELEILVTSTAVGPLNVWNADGSPVPGWPGIETRVAYPALGELSPDPGLEVFSGHYGGDLDLFARTGAGLDLTGWPKKSANYVGNPPSLADVDDDGLDEIFTEEEDWQLHAYRADGQALDGWPQYEGVGTQERHTPAVVDLDGDGDLEIVSGTGSSSGASGLVAYHHDGQPVEGFPAFYVNDVNTFPAVGDVDGDGGLEIVVGGWIAPATRGLFVFSADGTQERTLQTSNMYSYGIAPALADLDGDGFPEIIAKSALHVDVWKGDGSVYPGWPVELGTTDRPNHAEPVVGDVMGDAAPEIVALHFPNESYGEWGNLIILDTAGKVLITKRIEGLDAAPVPAIADVDRDGRNEVIVSACFWNGFTGYYDKVWVFDFGGETPHGPAHWPQYMGGPRHHGLYQPTLPNTAPFGSFDTPLDGASDVTGAIPVTGWALDDGGVAQVQIYRDPLAGEPTQPNGKVYVGDASFVAGARPDVQALYPDLPGADRAGWGYMLLTNFLPASGNGTFTLYAWARDAHGLSTLLGARTISCTNATATRPFGTIDTPGQGETVSGTIVNFGWALTPQPGAITVDGSTIWVFVDGVALGHPTYNQYRADIATLFPGYANSDGAVGAFVLDTTTLANGVHTIAWSVTDDLGRVDGIGSRYFTVAN